jgi:hypothetical protein
MRIPKRLCCGLAGLLAVIGIARAASNPCRTNPQLVGRCFVVHGRLFVANGNPTFRIWRVGTKRILGVNQSTHAAEDDPRDFPPEIRRFIPDKVWDIGDLYGDYTVCPFTQERPGWMQYVCIASATHLALAPINRTPPQRKEPSTKP